MDVTVDESRCDEPALEIDDLRLRKLLAPNIIAAEPSHDIIGNRDRGGVGHRGAVHPPVEEESRHHYSGLRSTAWDGTSMTSPSM
jgi:hypothetical protein